MKSFYALTMLSCALAWAETSSDIQAQCEVEQYVISLPRPNDPLAESRRYIKSGSSVFMLKLSLPDHLCFANNTFSRHYMQMLDGDQQTIKGWVLVGAPEDRNDANKNEMKVSISMELVPQGGMILLNDAFVVMVADGLQHQLTSAEPARTGSSFSIGEGGVHIIHAGKGESGKFTAIFKYRQQKEIAYIKPQSSKDSKPIQSNSIDKTTLSESNGNIYIIETYEFESVPEEISLSVGLWQNARPEKVRIHQSFSLGGTKTVSDQ